MARRLTPPTTAAGSIDVRAGEAQVIVTILKSGDWAGLHLAVAHPHLLELGSSLGQAQRLLKDHGALIIKLKEREGEAWHVLEDVHVKAASEEGTTKTSDALGQSVKLAWGQLSTLMHSRQALLQQAVHFFQSATEFSDRIEEAKQLLEKCQRSEDVGELEDYLLQHEQMRGLPAASARVASLCAALVEELQTFRHRCSSIASDICCQRGLRRGRIRLETLAEMLQDRFLHLQPQLEHQRAQLSVVVPIYCWDQEMDEMTQWFRDHGEHYLQVEQLGSCLEENEKLLDLHEDFNQKAKEVAEEVQSLLCQAEEMMAREGFSEEQAVSQRAQGIRALCQEFWRLMAQRRSSLHQAHVFFRAANEASNTLARLEIQVELIKSSSNGLAAQAKEQQDISNAVREVIGEAADKGKIFAAAANGASAGMEGVHRTLGDVKRRAQRLESACTAPAELLAQRQRQLHLLQELLEKVSSELQTKYEPILKSKCDVPSCEHENILDRHLHLMHLAKDVAGGVDQITDLIAQLQRLETPGIGSYEEDVALLHDNWAFMYADLQERTEVMRAYVAFLNSAGETRECLKSMEDFCKGELMNAGHEEEWQALVEQGNANWKTILKAMMSLYDLGTGFTTAASLVAPSARMSVKNMESVVASTTEALRNKKLQLMELWISCHVTLGWARSVDKNYRKELKEAILKASFELEKMEDLFVSLASTDLGQDRQTSAHLLLTLREDRPRFQGISADVEYLQMARNLLAACDSCCSEDAAEVDISGLMALHCRVRQQISESRRVLELAAKFHQVTDELDRLDWSKQLNQGWSVACLSRDITRAQTLLTHWQEKRTRVLSLHSLALSLNADIVTAVGASRTGAHAQRKKLSSATDVLAARCSEWGKRGVAVEQKLQMNLNLCTICEELKELAESYRDLKRKFNNLRFNYMKRPEKFRKVKAAINQVQQVEMYMEKLPAFKLRWQRFQDKFADLLSTCRETCAIQAQVIQSHEHEVAADVNEVARLMGNLDGPGKVVESDGWKSGGEVAEWNSKSAEILLKRAEELGADARDLDKDVCELERVVQEYRCNLELTIQLQDAMKDSHFSCEETLSTITRVRRFASECKTREGMAMLGSQFDLFLRPTVPEQQEKMKLIEDIALRIYGPEESRKYIEKTKTQHEEIMKSIQKMSKDIKELAANLIQVKEIEEHSENPVSEAHPSTLGHLPKKTVADVKENGLKNLPSEDETSKQTSSFSSLKDPLEIAGNRISDQNEKDSVELSSENASTSSLLCNSLCATGDSSKEQEQKQHRLRNDESFASAVCAESARVKLSNLQMHSSSKGVTVSDVRGCPEARRYRNEKAIAEGPQEWQTSDNSMAGRCAQMHDGGGIEQSVSSARFAEHRVCKHEPVFSRGFELSSHTSGYALSRAAQEHAQVQALAGTTAPFVMGNDQDTLDLDSQSGPCSVDLGNVARVKNFKCPYFSFVKLVMFNKSPVGHNEPALLERLKYSPGPPLGSARGDDGCSEQGLIREETQLALTPRCWYKLTGQVSRFTQPLASAEVIEGSPVTVEVTVGGSPEPTVVWLLNGQLLNSDANTEIGCSEDRHSLFIAKATLAHTGVYIARAENVAGAEASAVVLQVNSGNERSGLRQSFVSYDQS